MIWRASYFMTTKVQCQHKSSQHLWNWVFGISIHFAWRKLVVDLGLCFPIASNKTQNQETIIDGFTVAGFYMKTNPTTKKNTSLPCKASSCLLPPSNLAKSSSTSRPSVWKEGNPCPWIGGLLLLPAEFY